MVGDTLLKWNRSQGKLCGRENRSSASWQRKSFPKQIEREIEKRESEQIGRWHAIGMRDACGVCR